MQGSASRWHHLAFWLSLLALSLVFVGPVLSQTQRLLSMAEHHAHDSPLHHAGMAHHDASSGDAPPGHHDALSACHYCTFFLHMPGVLPRLPVVALLPAALRQALRMPRVQPLVAKRHSHYTGRAPPPWPISAAFSE